jgi:hypothetical protein
LWLPPEKRRTKKKKQLEDHGKDRHISTPCVMLCGTVFVYCITKISVAYISLSQIYLTCYVPLLKKNMNKFYGIQWQGVGSMYECAQNVGSLFGGGNDLLLNISVSDPAVS